MWEEGVKALPTPGKFSVGAYGGYQPPHKINFKFSNSTKLELFLYRPKPIHYNYQLVHYSDFCRISPSILNRFKPNLQA